MISSTAVKREIDSKSRTRLYVDNLALDAKRIRNSSASHGQAAAESSRNVVKTEETQKVEDLTQLLQDKTDECEDIQQEYKNLEACFQKSQNAKELLDEMNALKQVKTELLLWKVDKKQMLKEHQGLIDHLSDHVFSYPDTVFCRFAIRGECPKGAAACTYSHEVPILPSVARDQSYQGLRQNYSVLRERFRQLLKRIPDASDDGDELMPEDDAAPDGISETKPEPMDTERSPDDERKAVGVELSALNGNSKGIKRKADEKDILESPVTIKRKREFSPSTSPERSEAHHPPDTEMGRVERHLKDSEREFRKYRRDSESTIKRLESTLRDQRFELRKLRGSSSVSSILSQCKSSNMKDEVSRSRREIDDLKDAHAKAIDDLNSRLDRERREAFNFSDLYDREIALHDGTRTELLTAQEKVETLLQSTIGSAVTRVQKKHDEELRTLRAELAEAKLTQLKQDIADSAASGGPKVDQKPSEVARIGAQCARLQAGHERDLRVAELQRRQFGTLRDKFNKMWKLCTCSAHRKFIRARSPSPLPLPDSHTAVRSCSQASAPTKRTSRESERTTDRKRRRSSSKRDKPSERRESMSELKRISQKCDSQRKEISELRDQLAKRKKPDDSHRLQSELDRLRAEHADMLINMEWIKNSSVQKESELTRALALAQKRVTELQSEVSSLRCALQSSTEATTPPPSTLIDLSDSPEAVKHHPVASPPVQPQEVTVLGISDFRHTADGSAEYLLQWDGGLPPSWEPADNLHNCLDLITRFHAEQESAASQKGGNNDHLRRS
eukprot:917387_1